MTRVPRTDDPHTESDILTFEDFIIMMSAYWKYIRKNVMTVTKRKVTITTLLLFAFDYARLRFLSYLVG